MFIIGTTSEFTGQMENKKELQDFGTLAAVCIAFTLIFAYFLFGMTGARIMLMILGMTLPFFLIFQRFNLSYGEKTVFSLIFGITIFPSVVYLLGFIISFRMAIFATFILIFAVGIALNYFKRKNYSK